MTDALANALAGLSSSDEEEAPRTYRRDLDESDSDDGAADVRVGEKRSRDEAAAAGGGVAALEALVDDDDESSATGGGGGVAALEALVGDDDESSAGGNGGLAALEALVGDDDESSAGGNGGLAALEALVDDDDDDDDESSGGGGGGGLAALAALVGGGAAGGDGNDQVSKLDSLGQGVGDDKGSSLGKVTASTRSAIMAKLAESVSGGMEVPDDMRRAAQASGLVALPSSATSAEGSRCLVLKNMFDRLSDEAQSNPNFFAELADEVRGECARHGTVLHLQCDKWSNGFIYLKLLSHPEAARLRDTMHGRYFAKNKILAELVPEATYNLSLIHI